MRETMGKDKEGLVARGSWCGMKRNDGMVSFFSLATGVLGSTAAPPAPPSDVLVLLMSGERSTVVAARLLVIGAAGACSVEDESVELGWACAATRDRPLCPPTVGNQPLVEDPPVPERCGLGAVFSRSSLGARL